MSVKSEATQRAVRVVVEWSEGRANTSTLSEMIAKEIREAVATERTRVVALVRGGSAVLWDDNSAGAIAAAIEKLR